MSGDEHKLDQYPVLDEAFWVAVAVVGVATATCVLIMGIFATELDDRFVMIAGLNVIIAGPAVLLLMVVARLAFRIVAAQDNHRTKRAAAIVKGVIYAIVAPLMLAGTWQLVQLWIQPPVDREAGIAAPSSPTPAY
jgi:hypothetical protein